MTTIATDGRSIAADEQVTEGKVMTRNDYSKLRRLSDGRLVGFSGNCYHDDAFAEWLESGAKGEAPKNIDSENFSCLVLDPSGDVFTYDEHGRRFQEQPPYAIGSGHLLATAAMDLGKSPSEAVAYAATRDIYTSGEITVLTIEQQIRKAA